MTASSAHSDPANPPPGRLPDFIIAGHPKSGTTALFRMLRSHPQIYMPDMKETYFFVPEFHSRFRDPSAGRPDTLEQYEALFAGARPEQIAGEASPPYLMSLTAAERIAEVAPQMRIVVVLREPASFLRSLHMQYVQSHVEDQTDFATALSLEDARRRGEQLPPRSPRPQVLIYSDTVRYVEQLQRYHARFAPEQVLVLIYDDFRRDNDATVRRVLRFLGVDDGVPLAVTEANPAVRVRSQSLHELLRTVSTGKGPVALAARRSLKAVSSQRLRRAALRTFRRKVVFARPEAPDEQLMRELRRRFKGEVVALGEYLDRDLVSLWGYGDVD